MGFTYFMNNRQSFQIQGLAGEKKLTGTITIHGAKNAALKAMAAAILFDGPVQLENIPDTADIHTLVKILTKLGANVTKNKSTAKDSAGLNFLIDPSSINSTNIDDELAATMRGSVVLTGPLLARFGKVNFPAPGGCVIGARPIDLFIKGYESMGANVKEVQFTYNIESKSGLKGTETTFAKVSVGATETLMMAAVLAKGTTTLKNCAMEPEIVNVAEWLIRCGAIIRGVGTPTITIEGRNGELLKPTHPYVAIPDRIETGSYLILGALCAKNLTITNCRPDHLQSLIDLLINSGVPITADKNTITISNNTKPNNSFKAFNIQTHEYPGFPTDLQAPLVTFLTQVIGESSVVETIFEGRFKYVEDLQKLGANIKVLNPREVIIKGPALLRQLPDAEELTAHDIRAGFALVLAALVAQGTFKVNNIHLIDRGYEKLQEQLRSLGANVIRCSP